MREWVAATEVDERRQGQLFTFASGCVARRLLDDPDPGERQFAVDLPDGRGGHDHISTVEFIVRVLQTRLPVHQEARMLRIGLDFFKFQPRRCEHPEVWFQRFDNMLEEANQVAGLGLNQIFQSWMLLSLLQLPPCHWTDLLKDLGHRLPNIRQEYLTLQRTIFKERILEGSVFDLRDGARNVIMSQM